MPPQAEGPGLNDRKREVDAPADWSKRDMSSSYVELEHAADVLLEIRGGSLEELFENSLYGFYSQITDLDRVEAREYQELEVESMPPAEALRAMLGEALYVFDTQGYVGAAARVSLGAGAGIGNYRDGPVRVSAQLWGERLRPERHALLAEVKAVTYHRLSLSPTEDGWRATVLFDV